jgi:hypothetical protein
MENILEKHINSQVDKLIGANDVNLNTILKMNFLKKDKTILAQIKENNSVEKYYVEKEYQLTYDCNGNLIPIKDINGKTTRESENEFATHPSSILREQSESE